MLFLLLCWGGKKKGERELEGDWNMWKPSVCASLPISVNLPIMKVGVWVVLLPVVVARRIVPPFSNFNRQRGSIVYLVHSCVHCWSSIHAGFSHFTLNTPLSRPVLYSYNLPYNLSLSLFWKLRNILIIAIGVIILCVRGGIIEYTVENERTNLLGGAPHRLFLGNECVVTTHLNHCSLPVYPCRENI